MNPYIIGDMNLKMKSTIISRISITLLFLYLFPHEYSWGFFITNVVLNLTIKENILKLVGFVRTLMWYLSTKINGRWNEYKKWSD